MITAEDTDKLHVEHKIETSWDDGAIQDLRIATLLKKYKLPGTFYIIVDKVGTDNFLNWDQIKQLDAQGFSIGSHTVTHPTDLKALFEDQLHFEIQNSKDMIEAVLDHPISKFCYPRGRYDERVLEYVRDAKYTEARGTGKLGVTTVKSPYEMPGTIHIFQRPELKAKDLVDFAKETIDKVKSEGGYCNIWGHSWEIEKHNLWFALEQILEYAARKN